MSKINAVNDVYYQFEGGVRNVFSRRVKQLPTFFSKQSGVDELVLSRKAEQMKEAKKAPIYIQHEGRIEEKEI